MEAPEAAQPTASLGGSNHAGKRAAAAWQAHELARKYKLALFGALNPPATYEIERQSRRVWRDPKWLSPREPAVACLAWSEPLIQWKLSHKQKGCSKRIIEKCRNFAEYEKGEA